MEPNTPTQLSDYNLTPRETEIAHLVALGLSNRKIAAELFLALGTVKTHIHNLYDKLYVENRAEAVALLNRLGIGLDSAADTIDSDDMRDLTNPYKGLRSFQEVDAGDFFGRDELIAQLLARLSDDHDLQQFLAVVGPSGSGKSSVVKAGLIPALRQGRVIDSESWSIVEMLPGTRPLDELEIALRQSTATPPTDMHSILRADTYGLVKIARLMLPDTYLLLSVDQFEEVFTLTDDESQARHFLNLIYTASTDARSNVRTIITLRADFYDRPLMLPDFAQLVKARTEVITPMTAAELERAIVGPLEKLGVVAESQLIAAMVADTNDQPGALPMLQYALMDLFDHREGNTLTLATYQRMGGIQGVLAQRADEVYQALNPAQQAMARQLFLRLIALGEGTEDTRRRTALNEVLSLGARQMQPVIDAYDESRLLSFDRDRRNNEPTVEVAHEAIIREWERLRVWLDQSRADIRQHRLLSSAAQDWQANQRDTSYLLRGSRLEQATEWQQQSQLVLTSNETAFIDASQRERQHQAQAEQERRQREIELERRARRRAQLVAGVLTVAAVIGVMLTIAIFLQSREVAQERDNAENARSTSDVSALIAEQSAEQSQALFLAAEADNALDDGDTDLAIALIMEAYRLAPQAAGVRRTMAEVASVGGTMELFATIDENTTDFVISDDKTLLVAATNSTGRVIVWDLATREVLQECRVYEGRNDGNLFIGAVDLSSDNSMVAIGGDLGQRLHTRIIDPLSCENMISPLSGDGTIDLQIGPNDEYLGIIKVNGQIELWSIVDEKRLHQVSERINLDEPTLVGRSITFSLDGAVIAYSIMDYGDDTLYGQSWSGFVVRDVDSFERIYIKQYDGNIGFSSTILDNAEIYVWVNYNLEVNAFDIVDYIDVARRARLASAGSVSLQIPQNTFNGFAVSQQGYNQTSIMFGERNVVAIDLETGILKSTYIGNRNTAIDSEFIDPSMFITLSGGRGNAATSELRLWQTDVGRTIRTYHGLGGLMPNGVLTLISPEAPMTTQLIDMQSGNILSEIDLGVGIEPQFVVHDAALTRVAVASYNETTTSTQIDVLTWPDLQPISRFGHPYVTNALAFAADSSRIITGEWSISQVTSVRARLWDVETGNELNSWLIYGSVTFAIPFGEEVIFGGAIDSTLRVSGTSMELWHLHNGIVEHGALNQSESLLLTGDNLGTVILSNPHTRTKIREFSFHDLAVNWVAFAPDGIRAVSGDIDGNIVMWNIHTGELLHRFDNHSLGIDNLQFTPDGQYLLSGSPDGAGSGVQRVHSVPPYTTIEEMVAWLQNNRYIPEFTCQQRAQFNITPLCSTDPTPIAPATRTPFPTLTPSLTPTITNTPDLTRTTATPTHTASPTLTNTPPISTNTPTATRTPTATSTAQARGAIQVGVPLNGIVGINDRLTWTFEAIAGVTYRVNLNSGTIRMEVRDASGAVVLEGESFVDASFTAAESGTYEVILSAGLGAGPYSLTISE